MLRKPSLSLKKVVRSKRLMKAIKGHQRPSKDIKGHEVKKSEKSHFINHCLIYAQEAFHQHENSSKAQETDKGLQRPQSKKVTVSFYQSLLLNSSGWAIGHSTPILMSCVIKETNKDIGVLLQSQRVKINKLQFLQYLKLPINAH